MTQLASSLVPVELDNTDTRMCVTVLCVTQWHRLQPDSTEISLLNEEDKK